MLTKNKPMGPAKWNYLLVLPILSLMILISGWSATGQDQGNAKKEQLKKEVEKKFQELGFTKSGEGIWKKDGVTATLVYDTDLVHVNVVPDRAKASEAQLKTPMLIDKKLNGEDVFAVVEQMPHFQGGHIEDYRNWIQKNVEYPTEAKTKKIQGTVYVTFIVDTQGKVVKPEIIRSADPILDQEVMKALKSSPVWTPGKQKDKPVNVSFSMPVKFILDKSIKPSALEEEVEDGQVFQVVEVMPEFQGGSIEEFRNWVQAHVKYPPEAVQSSKKGTVYVSFVVSKSGTIKNIQVIRSIYPALDDEVVKVIKSAPAWNPGLQGGKPVNVSFSIPVKFILD